ncbi:hypothetical protein LSAT2_008615 [Lamellibrachia satsuma]|nr:hypothetical protein LSAT2_008615 [Lamellibrachia satsuma]
MTPAAKRYRGEGEGGKEMKGYRRGRRRKGRGRGREIARGRGSSRGRGRRRGTGRENNTIPINTLSPCRRCSPWRLDDAVAIDCLLTVSLHSAAPPATSPAVAVPSYSDTFPRPPHVTLCGCLNTSPIDRSEATDARRIRKIERGEWMSARGKRYCQTAPKSSIFNLLSYSSLLSTAGASVPSSSADVTMLQHIVAVCTFGYITLLCSQSAWTFPCNKKVCNHQPGPCRPVRGVDKGAGDIHVLPNGLALITSPQPGEDSFYFTNYYKSEFRVEFLRRLSFGNVVFYDGSRGHIVLAGCNTPTGINTSPDGKYVYLSETGRKRISVYIRECDNTLTLTQVVPLGTFSANINVDVVTGHLWVAAYPDPLKALNYLWPPHIGSPPSQVLRLTLSEDSKVTDVVESVLQRRTTNRYVKFRCTLPSIYAPVADDVFGRSIIKQSRGCGDSVIEPSGGGTVCIKSHHHLPKQSFENGGSHACTHATYQGAYYVSC